jgi:hypothetical protein
MPRNPLFALRFFLPSRQGDHANGPPISGVRRTRPIFIIFPCTAVSPHLAALGTSCCGIPGVWVQLPREATKPGHMTVGVTFFGGEDVCKWLQLPLSKRVFQAKALLRPRFVPIAGTLGHAALYIIGTSPIQNFSSFPSNQLQATRSTIHQFRRRIHDTSR